MLVSGCQLQVTGFRVQGCGVAYGDLLSCMASTVNSTALYSKFYVIFEGDFYILLLQALIQIK
jgi:hypothetical protein